MYIQSINSFRIIPPKSGYYNKNSLIDKPKLQEIPCDSVCFTGGRTAPLTCLPQSIDKILSGHAIHDIYSDTLLLNPKVVKNFDRIKVYKKSTPDILHEFMPYADYMHSVEREIFERLCKLTQNPKLSREDFTSLIKSMKPEAEQSLIKTQNKILNDIIYISSGLKPKYKILIEEFIENQRKLVAQPQNDVTFKRKRFLNDLENILKKVKSKRTAAAIYSAANKLPTSSNNINAFIVKYSERPSAAIAQRLITPPVASIEHIHPRSLGGENDWSNYALASVSQNSERGNSSLKEKCIQNPKIPKYVQRQVNELIDLANEGVITDKNYILCYRERFLQESEGLINLDITRLEGLKTDKSGNYYVENRFPDKKYYIMSLAKAERDKEIKRMYQEKLKAEREKQTKLIKPKEPPKPIQKYESPYDIEHEKDLQRKNNDFLTLGMGHIPHFNRLTVKDNHFNHPPKKKK